MIVLLALILISIAGYFLLPYLVKADFDQLDHFEEEVRRFRESPVDQSVSESQLTPFPFDPNKTSKDGFKQLGLSDRQADMILKYVNAGGRFRIAEDFGKMYSVSDEEFEILKSFIIIEEDATAGERASKSAESAPLSPIPFDPNKVDSSEMSRMGFRESQIRNVLNYRKAGGKFSTKKDFGKLYGFSDEDFQAIEKYILLPSVDTLKPISSGKDAEAPVIVEINTADTTELQKIKGIGPAFAKRIVNYREQLGGFYDKSQLLEVFGMDTAKYVQIAGQIELEKSKIRKMNLNKTVFKEMVGHPYLEFYIVKSIFDYKETKGKFDSVAELKQINLIYHQLYQKLENYFTVDTKETARK